MKKVVMMLAVAIVSLMTGATDSNAEAKRPYTGVYASLGTSKSDGEFTLSHYGPIISLGEILDVPLTGNVTTYELGYRFPLGQSKLRLGVNASLHDGSIGGAKYWHDHKSTAAFTIASDLRVSAGGELGLVLGKQERVYLYVGAGVVATNLSMGLSLDTPFGSWADSKEGGALGALYTIGVQYAVSDRFSIGLKASQMQFDADKAFGLGQMGNQTLEAKIKQTTVGLTLSYNF